MNMPISDPVMSPATSPKLGTAAERPPGQELDFQDRMQQTKSPDQTGNARPATGAVEAGKQVDAVANIDHARNNPARRVTRGTVPDRQDMFGQFEGVRRDFDAFLQKRGELDQMVADGKMKADDPKVQMQRQSEMRTLLHFQLEMQNAAMKVEIASKVVEHATSGVKTVLSTQA